ncbi:ABC transporter substrate-binding protein [Paenibacillus dakarensis]|uniref:ABC transporter substrate-binding protein n=1 Tax=Paenibacillus dakarensis TaxID=1527293 RepID=UPI0006D57499|nr:ABC transporter substrate-binding protein [Paenibacillus dakarensis]
MRQRFSAILLAVCLYALVLAGCSGGGNTVDGNTAKPEAPPKKEAGTEQASGKEGKTKVQFWHSLGGKNGEYISGMIERFNASQDSIEVVGTFQGSYDETVTKLQQSIAAKTAPDITMLERAYVQMFSESQVLEDMNPYMEKSGLSLDDFTQGLLGHSIFDEMLVSLPLNRSTPILHVNKTMLDEEGLSVPQTWDELRKVAEALVKKENNEITRYGYSMPYDTWYPIAMISQAGGRFFNEEATTLGFNEEGIKTFQFLKEMQASGALYYPPAQDSGNIVNQMFTSGKIGMMYQSTGTMGSLSENSKFEYVTALLPKDKVFANPTGGANIAMLADSNNKEAAWTFIHWVMTDPQGGLQFILDSGYLPFTTTMIESQAIQDLWAKEPNRKVAYDQLEYAVDTNMHIGWSQVMQEFFKAIQAIMYDNKDIETTMDTFKKETERILKQ